MRKKSEDDEKTLEELNLAHRCSQAECQLVQTSYIKRIKLFLFLRCNKHLINRAKSVKILPYRPPARLIRANYYMALSHKDWELQNSLFPKGPVIK